MYTVIGGDQKEYGPATVDEIKGWIAEGRLNGQSLVREEGSSELRPLSTIHEFAEDLSRQTERLLAAAVPPLMAPPEQSSSAPELEPATSINVGSCLKRSWQLFAGNPGLLFAGTFLVWMLSVIAQLLPLGGAFYWVVSGVLYGGLYLVFLKRIRGQPAAVSEVFAGFGPGFSHLMLAGIVTSLLSWVGFLFCVIPWLYLTIAWIFSVPLVADKQMEFWPAMERSRRTVNLVWFQVFGLALLAFLPIIAMNVIAQIKISTMLYAAMQEAFGPGGQPNLAKLMQMLPELTQKVAPASLPWIFATKLVMLLNLPFALGALMFAYEDLFGPRSGKT